MWVEQVDKKYKLLVDVLINDCDWSWTKTARLPNKPSKHEHWMTLNTQRAPTPLSASHIADYQVFILCKVVAGDLKVDSETKRLRLSPTEQIDEVWHQHLFRPVSYYEMCRKLHEAMQKLELKEDGEGDNLLHALDCIIDYIPESSNDSEEMKYERYKVTRSYLLKMCPSYVFTNPPLDPADMGTFLFDDPSEAEK
eukprot:gene8357-9041_t